MQDKAVMIFKKNAENGDQNIVGPQEETRRAMKMHDDN
jgi:hypothetical protein